MNESAWMEVRLDVLRDNAQKVKKYVRQRNDQTKVLAVVKADGYGHGAVEVSKVFQDAGINYLGVATVNEGVELRQNGITMPILVFGYVYEGLLSLCIEHDLTLTIYDNYTAELIEKLGEELGKLPKVHLKIDVGMTRLGLPMDEGSKGIVHSICQRKLKVEGIYGHFPLADGKDSSETIKQAKAFKAFVTETGINFDIVHLCNSAGMMRFDDYFFDMVRAGGILYGHFCLGHFIDEPIIDTKRAMSIRARIGNIREVDSDTGVSYGWLYKTDEKTQIGAIPLGYTDGIHRSNTNKAKFLYQGKWVHQVGLICMDQMMVNLGVDSKACMGDIITLLGEDGGQEITLEMRAKDAGIGKCELFAGIGRRLTKFYFEGSEMIDEKNYLL